MALNSIFKTTLMEDNKLYNVNINFMSLYYYIHQENIEKDKNDPTRINGLYKETLYNYYFSMDFVYDKQSLVEEDCINYDKNILISSIINYFKTKEIDLSCFDINFYKSYKLVESDEEGNINVLKEPLLLRILEPLNGRFSLEVKYGKSNYKITDKESIEFNKFLDYFYNNECDYIECRSIY